MVHSYSIKTWIQYNNWEAVYYRERRTRRKC